MIAGQVARGRIPSLDGLRALSISLVIWFHLAGDGALGGRAGGVGNLGVRIFFVISGYLITRLLLEEWTRDGVISLRRFYFRRMVRIFPAFYAYLVAIALASAAGWLTLLGRDLSQAGLYVSNYFGSVSQSAAIRHTWSLSVEEQFYLLWPVTLLLAGRKRGLTIAASVLVAAPAVRLLYWFAFPALHGAIDRHFETVSDALATGCVLAGTQTILAAHRQYDRVVRSAAYYGIPIVIGALAVFGPQHPRLFYGAGETVLNLLIAVSIDRFVRYPYSRAGVALNLPVVRWVGVLSYSLYLWQQPFLNAGRPGFFTAFPLNIGLAFVAAVASYYGIEKQFARLRKRSSAAVLHRASRNFATVSR